MLKGTLRFHSDRDGGGQDGLAGREGATVADVVDTYLDTLDLRKAIIGDDMVLEESDPHQFVLHQVVDCRARRIGAFQGAVDAWLAIDSVDSAAAGSSSQR
jgi:hypothetical protein